MLLILYGVLLCGLFRAGAARATPRSDNGMNRVRSVLDPKVSLSYKRTTICETTPGVKSYSGYINIPADAERGIPYDTHTFFWFFEARKSPKTAPLSLWLQGGPGSPSIPAALGENGPCFVTPDSRSTTLNPWSWNNEVNLLYIDQPVQTGFSYDTLVNGTIDETLLPYNVTPVAPGSPAPKLNSTVLMGVFPSQDIKSTANTTTQAAHVAWNFMQIWMKQFPEYKPKDNKFSIWTESYGGHYGPTFADYFSKQSKKLCGSNKKDAAIPLRLDTVGIVNGCIDILTQMPSYPHMAFNNTYGFRTINETEFKAAVDSFPQCRSLVEACRSLADAKDPSGTGSVAEVNKACSDAFGYCFKSMWSGVQDRGRNVFDITATVPGSFPPKYAAGYLNTKEIQEELGVPLNFSGLSSAVSNAFTATGDFVLGRNLAILGELLDQGVKVALMYGDRDYQCNWLGGEQISLAIQSNTSDAFRKSGYAEIKTAGSEVGGYVRQHGRLSFSRVLGAGHEAPWYQPETAYQIFHRVMFNKDVATGQVSLLSKYSTSGPADVFGIKNVTPADRKPECYFWDIFETCSPAQAQMIRNGTAILKDFIMVGYETEKGDVFY